MKNRIYNYFYRKLHIKFLAKVIACLGYGLLYIYFLVKKNSCKDTINISIEDSYKVINDYSKKPEGDYSLIEQPLDITMDLSIIIPVYNASNYIEKCLDSVVNQNTRYKYEVIVINDGSTDDTLSKLSKYEGINVISIENRGIAGARNEGIDNAKGMYFMFVDSDDVLASDAIETLLKSAYKNNAEIVQGSYYEFINENKKMYYYLDEKVIESAKYNDVLPAPGFPWGKVIRRDLFNGIRFPLNYWFEDTVISYVIFRRCKKYVQLRTIVYGYRKNISGITNNYNSSHKSMDTFYVVEYMISECKRLGMIKDKVLYKITVNQLSSILLRRTRDVNEDILKNIFNLSCNLLKEVKIDIHEDESYLFKELVKSFETRNFDLWKLCSFII